MREKNEPRDVTIDVFVKANRTINADNCLIKSLCFSLGLNKRKVNGKSIQCRYYSEYDVWVLSDSVNTDCPLDQMSLDSIGLYMYDSMENIQIDKNNFHNTSFKPVYIRYSTDDTDYTQVLARKEEMFHGI